MLALARSRSTWLALLLVASAAACKQPTGTFVVLKFDGTVLAGKPIHSIEFTLHLGTRYRNRQRARDRRTDCPNHRAPVRHKR
jgi:hypothetical protein